MSKADSIVYSFIKPWVGLGVRIFFRKIELVNLDNIPKDRPVILVANHQNALLDPVLLCIMLPEQLHWLTRADLFKKATVSKLLRSFNMLPVYRERDNVDLNTTNDKTYKEFNERLKKNAVMCLFPEGAHRGKKQLSVLKKGVARQALNAVESGLEDLCIVPVGLDYGSFYDYQSTFHVKIGHPISVKELLAEHDNQARAQYVLLNTIRESFKNVMIDIEDNDHYELTLGLQMLCNKLSGSSSLDKQFSYYANTVQLINHDTGTHEELKRLAEPYISLQEELRIREDLFLENGFSLKKKLLFILGIPPALIACLFFYPIYYLAEYLVKKIVKDPLFVNSIRLVIWTFATPIYLLIIGLLFISTTGLGWHYFPAILLPVLCGLITLRWRILYKQFFQNRRCEKFKTEKNNSFSQWLKIRQELKEWISKLNTN